MKTFLVVFSLVVLVVAIKADHHLGGDKEEQGLSCEAKEGCCKDSLDCPGCCNPPYDNQCSNLKGIPFNFCEVTGTWFLTGVSLNITLFTPTGIVCPSINIAGNYPGQCQGSVFANYKKNTTDANGRIVYVSQQSLEIDIVRFSSCGHMVFNNPLIQLAEPFLVNAAVVARNEAGLANVVCYAIYKSPVLFSYIISPTPNPNPWAYGELKEALEPYWANGPTPIFQSFNYTGCYPTLTK